MINRIIDFFPLEQNKQIRAMLAGTLQGIISQRLVRTVDGKGRVPIVEVMVATSRIKDMIEDPEQTGKIGEAIAEGAYYGMQTFDQALLTHLQAGNITMDEAMKAATSPNDFKLSVAAGGSDGSMDKVMEAAKADHDAQKAAAEAEAAAKAAAAQQQQQAAQQQPQQPVVPQMDPEELARRMEQQAQPVAPGGGAQPPSQNGVG